MHFTCCCNLKKKIREQKGESQVKADGLKNVECLHTYGLFGGLLSACVCVCMCACVGYSINNNSSNNIIIISSCKHLTFLSYYVFALPFAEANFLDCLGIGIGISLPSPSIFLSVSLCMPYALSSFHCFPFSLSTSLSRCHSLPVTPHDSDF